MSDPLQPSGIALYANGDPSQLAEVPAGYSGLAFDQAGRLLVRNGTVNDRIVTESVFDALLQPFRPVVLTQPTAASVNVGDSLSLSCLGGILPNTHLNLTYQWQLSTDAGVSYSNITGATNQTIPFTPVLVSNNGLYRCRLGNEFGFQNTDAVALTVDGSITHLFPTTAERGVAWDLDQIGTLWQNSAGTTPVTAYGDPVGKVDDVSGNGNHLMQATNARRPTYARRPKSGIRNLLTFTNDITGSGWTSTRQAVTGTEENQKIIPSVDNDTHLTSRSFSFISEQTFSFAFDAKAAEYEAVSMRLGAGSFTFNLADGVVNAGNTFNLSFWALGAVTIEPKGDGWFRCKATVTRTGITQTQLVGFTAIASKNFTLSGTSGEQPSFAGDGVSGILVRRPQIEIGTTATPYQRVGNQFDVTESGQPSINYLWFDGIDDCLQSATAIDFGNSDEMTVCVGARKLTDASQRSLIELGASVDANDGTFQLTAPNGASTSYAIRSRGTNTVTAEATGFAQPDMAILTGQIDISSDLLTLRRNGVQVATSSSDQGSSNFANATLFVGARNNASDRFSGHLNSGFIINKILDPLILADYEKYWVGVKAGVDLP